MDRTQLRNEFLCVNVNRGRVDLSKQDISCTIFADVISSLPPQPSLVDLNLSHTKLGDDGIRSLADACKAGTFPNLRELCLSRTGHGNKGVMEIVRAANSKSLQQLRLLDLSGNGITDESVIELSRALGDHKLPNLESLGLGGTLMGNGGVGVLANAAADKKLPHLKLLNLSALRIDDTAAKLLARAALEKGFPLLQTLWLHLTRLGDVGVQSLIQAAIEEGFEQLGSLSLDRTQIGKKAIDALTDAFEQHAFPKLSFLTLSSTDATAEAIESLKCAAKANGLPRLRIQIKNHPRKAAADASVTSKALHRPCAQEVRILVLGERGVGKSSFCKRMFLNEMPSRSEETHDIEILKSKWNLRNGNVELDLKVWDLGGQPISQVTHQLFFANRSIVILVLDATRSVADNNAEYWIKLICHYRGPTTSIIVVVTKCDGGNTIENRALGPLNPTELQFDLAKAPSVVNGFSSSISQPEPGQPESSVIKRLRSLIAGAIQNSDVLDDGLSLQVARVQSLVESELNDQILIPLSDYMNWCRENGIENPQAQAILRILHIRGILIFCGLTDIEKHNALDDKFIDKLPLGEQRLLTNPRDSILEHWIANFRWLNWTAQEVIRRLAHSMGESNGEITIDEILTITLQATGDLRLGIPSQYCATYLCKVLELIGVCWELSRGTYFFPCCLPKYEPYNCDTWTRIGWWKWPFLPGYSFQQFVVRMRERNEVVQDTQGRWQHWCEAVVIEHPIGCRAAILVDSAKGHLEARRDPESHADEHFLGLLCHYVDGLFEKEFVKQPATDKDLPSIDIALEWAAPIVIHNAMKVVFGEGTEWLPNEKSFAGRPIKSNRVKGHGKKFHVEAALDFIMDNYKDHMCEKPFTVRSKIQAAVIFLLKGVNIKELMAQDHLRSPQPNSKHEGT